MKLDKIIEGVIALRQKKSELKKEFDGKAAEIEDAIKLAEAVLLEHFQKTGTESARTAAGTAYKSVRRFTSTADWESFLEFVRENEAWDMLTKKPANSAVLEWAEDNGQLPPGINARTEITINIQRS